MSTMNDYHELTLALDRLKRNETKMSEDQKKQYGEQLKALKQHIKSLALRIGREFLFQGIRTAKNDIYALERIRSVLLDDEIRDAERAALAALFDSYSIDAYLTLLCPLQRKIYYEGYGRYWTTHCMAVSDRDSETEFSYYNDLVDMFWSPKWHLWKKKDRWAVSILLPPTQKMVNEAYAEELSETEADHERK